MEFLFFFLLNQVPSSARAHHIMLSDAASGNAKPLEKGKDEAEQGAVVLDDEGNRVRLRFQVLYFSSQGIDDEDGRTCRAYCQ